MTGCLKHPAILEQPGLTSSSRRHHKPDASLLLLLPHSSKRHLSNEVTRSGSRQDRSMSFWNESLMAWLKPHQLFMKLTKAEQCLGVAFMAKITPCRDTWRYCHNTGQRDSTVRRESVSRSFPLKLLYCFPYFCSILRVRWQQDRWTLCKQNLNKIGCVQADVFAITACNTALQNSFIACSRRRCLSTALSHERIGVPGVALQGGRTRQDTTGGSGTRK